MAFERFDAEITARDNLRLEIAELATKASGAQV